MTGGGSPPPLPPEAARRVRLVVFDADGVLTDGGIYVGADAEGREFELRRFHVQDGIGVFMLRHAGIVPAVVSGGRSRALARRAAALGIEEVHQVDPLGKLQAVDGVRERAGVAWSETACLADDLADLPVLRRAGLPAAVANAVVEVRGAAAWTGSVAGGRGAVREFVEALLRARGEWEDLVRAYLARCESAWRESSDG